MENELKEPIELFGIECGKGWLPLIEKAKALVDDWNSEHVDEQGNFNTWGGEKLEFVQIKEKWGELCLYLNFYPDKLFEKILDLQRESLNMCEFCGSKENVSTKWTHHWLMTLCPECRAKEEKEWNERMKKYEPITTTKFEVEFKLPKEINTKTKNE